MLPSFTAWTRVRTHSAHRAAVTAGSSSGFVYKATFGERSLTLHKAVRAGGGREGNAVGADGRARHLTLEMESDDRAVLQGARQVCVQEMQ
jgi:hypothetical protein